MVRESPFDPPPEILRLLSEQPTSRVTLYSGQQAWLVTRYEDVRTLLTNPAVSADVRKPGYPVVSEALAHFTEGLLNHMDSPEHDRYRRMLVPKFMVKRIEQLRPEIALTVDGLVDAMLASEKPVDLASALALAVPGQAVGALLGVPEVDRAYFAKNAESCLSGSLELAQAASRELHTYLQELVASRQAEPADDLISQLVVEFVNTGALTAEDLVIQSRLLLVAGFDTTANMITLGLLLLMQHEEQFAALRADPGLIPGAVEELLRYLTVTHRGRHRVATQDIELSGQLIRAGEGVIAAQDAANRDPAVFERPNELDIRRPNARYHLAFGFGPHQCLGASLARIELQVAFEAVLRKIPGIRLAVPVDDIRFKHDSSVYGLYSMPVTW
jgi:cytochrome P450